MELKQPLTLDDQVNRLREHGIDVSDPVSAKTILRRIGYYRFTGYALQFRKTPSNSDCDDGTTFENIFRIYLFDHNMRCILRKYLEIAEVYYKALIANTFSLEKCLDSPHDQHYDRNNYCDRIGFDEVMDSLKNEGKTYYRDSLILKHHKTKYSGKLPLWAMLELLSFANASKLYNAMFDSDKELIASNVGIASDTLTNHLHCLSVLRNKCSHCARLYNTTMSPPAHLSEKYKKRHPEVINNTLFAYIIVLLQRLPSRDIKKELKSDIVSIIESHKQFINMTCIGFPDNYEILMEGVL